MRSFVSFLAVFLVLTGSGNSYAFAKAEKEPLTTEIAHSKAAPDEKQPCSTLIMPTDGATNVPVETTITWDPTPGNFGYIITLGTTSGGDEIVGSTGVGTNSYTPPLGLPENTVIYVNIEVRDSSSTSFACDEQTFTTGTITQLSECTNLITPTDGQTDVPITTNLSWTYAPRATNYIVQLGTTPGASDVLDVDTGSNALTYTIPFNLDFGTTYYGRVIPENGVGERQDCAEISFTTIVLDDDVPACTQLFTPADGAENVALTPLLEWAPVPNADGYLLNIGTAPGLGDVLNNEDLRENTSTLVLDFDEGVTYYVTVTPYNTAGNAINCLETSFTTTLGCGPYLDSDGSLVDLNPVINLEEEYILCLNDIPLELSYDGLGTQFKWIQILQNSEREISNSRSVAIEEAGNYRLEVINDIILGDGVSPLMCESFQEFKVITSEAAVVTGIEVRNQGFNFRLTIEIEGSSDYEFSLNNPDGPYQDSNVFNNININNEIVYIRDKNGCGLTIQEVNWSRGFPKYFTPNGDGINDRWQVRGVRVMGETVTNIQIFDRYGKMMAEFSARGLGWDGTYNGNQLLDAGYWFQAFTEGNVVFKGHFALRR